MIIPGPATITPAQIPDNSLILSKILIKLQEAAVAIHEMADQDYELEDSLEEEALEILDKE